MNVKISYTIPFDRVPSKIDELLMEAGKDLENVGHSLKPVSFDYEPTTTMLTLDRIDEVRKKLTAVDLVLEDCYTILASYNKAMADMKMPRKEQENVGLAREGGLSSNSTESGNGKVE